MIKATRITIVQAEGRISECERPMVATGPNCWEEIEKQWRDRSIEAMTPREIGCNKCDFEILFEDGENYQGHICMYHPDAEHFETLTDHVRSYNEIHAEVRNPSHLQNEPERLKAFRNFYRKHAPELKKKCSEFLERYQIG